MLNSLFQKASIVLEQKVDELKESVRDEKGEVNVVAIILLVVVAVSLVVVFWGWISEFVQSLIAKIGGKADSIGE